MSARGVVGAVGRVLVGAGVLILLFAVYQLFGTNISAAHSQDALRQQFAQELRHPVAADPATVAAPAMAAPAVAPAPEGDAVAIIKIPKIGVEKAVVQGVGEADLRQGPGHYPGTPMPGQPGNAAIAGHRTTYGAPFYRLNELALGDPIDVTTRQGSFVYKVLQPPLVVSPDDVAVVAPTKDDRLTLTTCNPRFSASQRLVVVAELVSHAVNPPPAGAAVIARGTSRGGTLTTSHPLTHNLAGGQGAWLPALLWGLVVLAVGTLVWLVARWGRRRSRSRAWLAYGAGVAPMVVALFLFFESVSVLLPASI